jgi:hypothetical protein
VARRRGKVWISLIVVFLVLFGLFVVADRVAAYVAEQTVAEKVSSEVKNLGVSSSEPDVTVRGFPFLTQVLDGKYQEITIVLRDVSANGVTLPVLDIHATGVNAKMSTLMSGNGPVTADKVAGTATVGYDSVRALVNQPGLQVDEEGGKLRLRLPVTIAGQQITAIGVGEVSVNSGKVRVAVTDIRAEGVTLSGRAQALLDDYKQRLSFEVRVPPLPFKLRIENVRPQPEGLAISASAQGVPLSS